MSTRITKKQLISKLETCEKDKSEFLLQNKKLSQDFTNLKNKYQDLEKDLRIASQNSTYFRSELSSQKDKFKIKQNQIIISYISEILSILDFTLDIKSHINTQEISYIQTKILQILENHKVFPHPTKEYDPKIHEIVKCENPEIKDFQNYKIIKIIKPGYKLDNTNLRNSKVVVRKQ
jgi:molecular chaperone GrpE (heat shock protein)